MKSLIISGNAGIRVLEGELEIKHKEIEKYRPARIPYDNIILTRPSGFVSFDAIRMLTDKNISLSLLDYDNSVISEITQVKNNGIRKIRQYEAYKNERSKYAKSILQGKFQHSIDFLNYLKQRYEFDMPKFEELSKVKNEKEILGIEGINANLYWKAITKIINDNYPDWDFRGRTTNNSHNMNADCEINSLFNFGYKLLEITIRKYLNSSGLDTSIGFVHEIRPSREPLVYDMQEPFRFLIDYIVLMALENKAFSKRDFYHTREYIYRLNDVAKARLVQLFDGVLNDTVKYKGLNQKWASVIEMKCNELAKAIESGNEVDMKEPRFFKQRTDTTEQRQAILEEKYSDRAKQGLSKGTLWYRKHRIQSGLPLKLYKPRQRI